MNREDELQGIIELQEIELKAKDKALERALRDVDMFEKLANENKS